jgi:hypothetical protein
LLCSSCTWIASKVEEVVSPSVSDFVFMSDNIYTAEQVQDMEMRVCLALRFNLWHITPFHYAQEFLLASQEGNQNSACQIFHPVLQNMFYYLLELSRLPYALVSTKPSLLAAAAIFLARATLGIRDTASSTVDAKGYWTKTLQYYTGYTVSELKATILVLLICQRGAEESSATKSTFAKYNRAKFMYVSSKTCVSAEDLGF